MSAGAVSVSLATVSQRSHRLPQDSLLVPPNQAQRATRGRPASSLRSRTPSRPRPRSASAISGLPRPVGARGATAAAGAAPGGTGDAAARDAGSLPGSDDAIRRAPLTNGIRLVTERMPDVRSVAIGFWVDVGSRDEELGMGGASHFLEHLLFKGTERRSARDIAEAVEAVGGEMNAFTTKEYTAFYTRLLDEDLDLGLDILCDIMSAPAFRPDEIEAERQVILEEILMHEDEPAEVVHELFTEALYPGHPLGRDVLGTAESISAMSREAIAGHFATHYRPANLVLAAAGHLDHDAVAAGLE